MPGIRPARTRKWIRQTASSGSISGRYQRLHGIEPWAYLRDLLCLLPSWPKSRVLELSPACWQQTLQHENT